MPELKRSKTAAIFPAFGCRYRGNEQEILNGLSGDLRDMLSRACKSVDINMHEFLSRAGGDFKDELQSQYAVYLYGCAVSNIVKRYGIHTDYAAGYSMGLYAALYHAESITFEQGLDLITAAAAAIRRATAGLEFGLGVISGLVRDDVRALIATHHDLEIININNRHSVLISGYLKHVREVLSRAKSEGALNATLLTFNSPYHSRFMNGAAREFRDCCAGVRIYDPLCRIISTVDQREISSAEGVLSDLVDNINHNINWLATMERMISTGTDVFIECGPGKSLRNIAKFIDGDFVVYHLNKINELFSSRGVCTSADAVNQ